LQFIHQVLGTGNLSSDPLFVTPIAYSSAPTTAGDYHLQTTSPALDVGSNAALPVDSYDIDADSNTAETLPIDLDGDARVFNAVVDMGAYELGSLLNRLNNPSFETAGTLATKALNWNVTNPKATDKRLCDKPAKPLTTADGLCVYQFSGGNVNSLARTLKQIINAPSWAVSGGSLTISAMVEGNKFKTGAKMVLQVTYTDNTKTNATVIIPNGTYAFTEISGSVSLTKPVSKIQVLFKIAKVSGRVRLDDVWLTATPVASRSDSTVRDGALTLPLPRVPDGFRGGN